MSYTPDELATLIAEMTTKLDQVLSYGFGAGGAVKMVRLAGVGPHLIEPTHYGKQLEITSGGAAATIVLPATAPEGALFMVYGLDCIVTVTTAAGAERTSWQSAHTGSAAPLAPLTVHCRANAGGIAARWLMWGASA